MSPYKLVYEKPCYLPVELEHKAYWIIKAFNSNLDYVGYMTKVPHWLEMGRIMGI